MLLFVISECWIEWVEGGQECQLNFINWNCMNKAGGDMHVRSIWDDPREDFVYPHFAQFLWLYWWLSTSQDLEYNVDTNSSILVVAEWQNGTAVQRLLKHSLDCGDFSFCVIFVKKIKKDPIYRVLNSTYAPLMHQPRIAMWVSHWLGTSPYHTYKPHNHPSENFQVLGGFQKYSPLSSTSLPLFVIT